MCNLFSSAAKLQYTSTQAVHITSNNKTQRNLKTNLVYNRIVDVNIEL
jgi:hypothetical protein